MSKKLARFGALASVAATLAISFMPFAAQAAPPPDVFKDSDGNVYIHGSTATSLGESTRISIDTPLVRKVRAGYCGEIRLSTSSSLPSIGDSWKVNGGTTIARSSLATFSNPDLVPKCSQNSFVPTASGNFIDGDRVVLTGFTPGMSYDVTFMDVDSFRSVRANECNFFRISNTTKSPVPASFMIGSNSYTTASLTMADPPLCRSNVRYVPSTW